MAGGLSGRAEGGRGGIYVFDSTSVSGWLTRYAAINAIIHTKNAAQMTSLHNPCVLYCAVSRRVVATNSRITCACSDSGQWRRLRICPFGRGSSSRVFNGPGIAASLYVVLIYSCHHHQGHVSLQLKRARACPLCCAPCLMACCVHYVGEDYGRSISDSGGSANTL